MRTWGLYLGITDTGVSVVPGIMHFAHATPTSILLFVDPEEYLELHLLFQNFRTQNKHSFHIMNSEKLII
jgi:hypothetical protein